MGCIPQNGLWTMAPAAKLLLRPVMMPAPIPPNETARLKALKRYAVLDTPPDGSFDRITRSAAHRFAVPIALISLIDQKRQWFKSCIGMSAADVGREITFCAHAILADEVLIVPDTRNDARFRENPQVTGAPFIRFYAGAPLVTADGFRLGTLCIVDTAPRTFRPCEAADLQDLAAMVIETLEARRAVAPLAAAVESTASGVVICDPGRPDLPIIFANPTFCRMTGYRRDEVLDRNCRFLQGPDTDPATVEQMRVAIATRQPFSGTVRNYRQDGTPFWNALHLNPVRDDFGDLVSFVGVQSDVTTQVEALEQARESAARLALAQQVAQVGSWECTFTAAGELDTTSLLWSDETHRMFHVAASATVNLWEQFFACVHPDDRSKVRSALNGAVRGRQRYRVDHRLVRRDGSQRVVHEEGEIIVDEATGKPLRMVGTVQDITERVFAAAVGRHLTETRELPEMLRCCTQSMVELLDAAFARIWTLNERENVLELRASSGMYTHLNGPHGRVPVGEFKIGRIASERLPHLTNQVLGDPRVPEQTWAREKGLKAFAGYPLIVDDRLVGVMAMFSRHELSERTLEAMASVARHIALGIERKAAEATAAQLAAIVESSGDAIYSQSPQGIILNWNRGAEAFFGFTEAEAIGQPTLRLIVPADRQREEEAALRRAACGEHVTFIESVRVRKDGSLVDVSLAVSPIRDAAGAVVACSTISRDITARKAVDEALRKSEENHRALFDTNPLPSWVFDLATLAFLEVNQAAVIHYGYTREEFLAMTLLDLCPSEQAAASLPPQPGAASSRPRPSHHQHRKKDGTRIEVEINGAEVTFAGRPARLAVANDVTERRRTEQALRESKSRYERIAANVPGMVYQRVLRPDGSIAFPFVSEGCREVFGLEPWEIQADPQFILKLVVPEDRASYIESVRTAADGLNPWAWEGRMARADTGEVRCIQGASRAERMPGGEIVWEGLFIDITERTRAEEHRRAKEEAERANRAKSEFLSRMSHELRTPLNAILGFGQLLALSPLETEDAASVKHILTGGQHLLGLIDEVLDLSRAETGELRLVPGRVDLHELLHDCLEMVARLSETRRVTCTIKRIRRGRTSLWCDEQRVRQILLNLLSNAIKYNHEGGQVIVSTDEPTAGKLRIHVTDTGPGISPEGIARLFVPFERLEQQYGEVEGTGLGLVVSKRIAEAMGSELGVESVVGRGTTFWIDVARVASPPAPAAASPPPENPSGAIPPVPTPATLLYIEDNLSNLQLVQMLLARQRPHWRLLSARDSTGGLEQARRHAPDVILLDLQLPGMRGEKILDCLRRDPSTSRIPVIVLSADATVHTREQLLRQGADAYVSKPLDVRPFLETLNLALAKVEPGRFSLHPTAITRHEG